MGNILKKYNLTKTQWEVVGGAITGDTLPIGAIMPYTSKTTPSNWLPCNGQAVSRTTYADLFAIIGTQYGAGDGSTTFNVPDLNDYKVPIGYDRFEEQSNRMNLGTTGGEETHTLTVDEMPSHAHTNAMFSMNAIDNNYGFAQGGTYTDRAVGRADTSQYNVLNGVQNIQNAGGSQAHNNMQPYVTTNYIIKAFQSSGVVAQVSNTKSDSTTDTYSCDYINGINKYSTEETIVGYDDNQKPVYRKVFKGSLASMTVIAENVESYYGCYGCVEMDTNTYPSLPYYEYSTSGAYLSTIQYISSNNTIRFVAQKAGANVTVNVNFYVEYTKTTD